jgi:hypothetical protein
MLTRRNLSATNAADLNPQRNMTPAAGELAIFHGRAVFIMVQLAALLLNIAE